MSEGHASRDLRRRDAAAATVNLHKLERDKTSILSLLADGACATSGFLAVRPFQPSEIPLVKVEFTSSCCSHAAEPKLLVAAVAGRQAERRYVARHAALRSRWKLHRDDWRILLSELALMRFSRAWT